MRCVLINLARATERRAMMTRQLDDLGIDYDILTATDWRDLTDSDRQMVDAEARIQQGRRPLTDGMIGCWLSHRRAIARIADGDDAMALILEDDAELSPDIKPILQTINNRHRDDDLFDIIMLNRMKPDSAIRKFIPLTQLPTSAPTSAPYELGMLRYSDWGAMGYIITRRAAAEFLRKYPKVTHQFDHCLRAYWLHHLRVFNIHPPLISHAHKSDADSFLQEAPKAKRQRTATGIMRRARAGMVEFANMITTFHQLQRRANVATTNRDC